MISHNLPAFAALKIAVESHRTAKKAFDDWYDSRHQSGKPAPMPTNETVDEQTKLMRALGKAERDVILAAEELVA